MEAAASSYWVDDDEMLLMMDAMEGSSQRSGDVSLTYEQQLVLNLVQDGKVTRIIPKLGKCRLYIANVDDCGAIALHS